MPKAPHRELQTWGSSCFAEALRELVTPSDSLLMWQAENPNPGHHRETVNYWALCLKGRPRLEAGGETEEH